MPCDLSQRENNHSATRDSPAVKDRHWLKVDLAPSQFHIRAGWFLHPGQLSTRKLLMGETSSLRHAKGTTLCHSRCGWPHLVLHQQRALRGVGEMGSSPLDHQLKGGVWLNIGQILFPQDGARAALDAKELQDKQILTRQEINSRTDYPYKLEQSESAACVCARGLLPRAYVLTLPEAVTITIIFCRLNSSLANVSMLISFLIWLRGFRAS